MYTPEQRKKVISVAESYIGTPYHHQGRVKGAGVDCATLLLNVFHDAGLMPFIPILSERDAADREAESFIPAYPEQWHLHRDEERYLNIIRRFADEIPASQAQSGDLVVFKFGRVFSHGAIIVNWPLVIHSVIRMKVGYCDALKDGLLLGRPTTFFTPRLAK